MNRLQQKCVIASASLHLLLAGVLLIGPGFLSSSVPEQDLPLIDFVPVKTVDALISGGGNPNARPPAPAVQPEPPRPAPMPAAPPETPEPKPREIPKAEPAPEPKDDSESLETGKSRKHRVEVSTKIVKRNGATSRSADRARDTAARQHAATAINQVVAGIQSGLSGSTSIELKGPGGGGAPYANFLQAVKKVYTDAWVLPEGITDDSATVAVSITIARDGKVVDSKISRRSGNSGLDHSVQMTLDRVRYAAPLPDDAKEDQRTVTINFNIKAKLIG